MLETELALANAQEQNGIIPQGTIATLQQIFQKINIDIEKIREQIPLSGNAAAPFVKHLIKEVKNENPEAAKYIHLGVTSQDIVDTATVLKAKHFLIWLNEKITSLEKKLVELTKQHRQTVMIGRTLMQQARPITFGLKTAGWLQGLRTANQHLQFAASQLLRIQL